MKILFSEKIWEQITSLWRDKKNVDLDIADEKLGKAILKNEGVPSDKKLLGVSVRKWQNLGSDFIFKN